jgi:hypothetical protein
MPLKTLNVQTSGHIGCMFVVEGMVPAGDSVGTAKTAKGKRATPRMVETLITVMIICSTPPNSTPRILTMPSRTSTLIVTKRGPL